MRPYAPARRSSSLLGPLLAAGGVAVVGVLGTVFALWAAGVDLPFLAAEKGPRVRIPANVRLIPAYSQVRREDLIDPEKKLLNFIELPPENVRGMTVVAFAAGGEQVTDVITGHRLEGKSILFETRSGKTVHEAAVISLSGTLMNINDILGRVLAKDKNPNFAFREDSFLPKGTRPGMAAGIPAGMQALTIETSKLSGVHGLKQGDAVDLLAAIPKDLLADFDPSFRRHQRDQFVSKSRRKEESPASETRLLAASVVIVQPVRMRSKAESTSSLTQGKRVQAIPVEEIVLAIAEADVPQVQLALSRDLALTAVAQTGRPDDAPPQRPASMVEVLRVTRRIPAFEEVQEADFIDPQTRRQDIDYVEPDSARQRKILPHRLLPGRVVKRDIEPGEILTEDDLLPIGARPGAGAGIPVDRQAITLDATKLFGSELLRRGDRLDVLGAFSLESRTAAGNNAGTDNAQVLSTSTQAIRRETELPWSDTLGQRSEHWFLALDALVVSFAESSPAEGAAPIARSLTLAVHPRDVSVLAQAAAAPEIVLTAAIRSNLPEDLYPAELPQGLKRVAVCGEHLRAFRPLNPWSAAVRRPAWKYLPADEAASAGWLTDLSAYGARVLKRNKAPGELFTENDFFPAGTRPGMASAVPSGMRAVLLTRERGRLDASTTDAGGANRSERSAFDRIKGLELLEAGQVIDLLALRTASYPAGAQVIGAAAERAVVSVLAPGAQVVQILEAPGEGVVGAVVAVPAESASELNEALLTALELRIVVRPEPAATTSDDPPVISQVSGELAGFNPVARAVAIERIVGEDRQTIVFPGAPAGAPR